MNVQKKTSLHFSAMVLCIIVVIALCIVAVYVKINSQKNIDSPNSASGIQETEGEQQTAAIMKEMMGVENEQDLPVVQPEDRVEELEPTISPDGFKEFELTAEPIVWEYAEGKTITAWGYNGQIPGPAIRVTEGDNVRVKFTNNVPKATTIHWHGIDVPSNQDGVPGVNQEPIQPGETFTYEFTASPAGTRFYHTHGSSHADEAQQLDMGLSGAFIIEPKEFEKPDQDITLLLDEWQTDGSTHAAYNMAMMNMQHEGEHMMNYNLYTINGRAFPDIPAIQVKEGERIRMRLINAGTSTTHPIHLHGQSFKVVAIDGNDVPEAVQQTRDTLPVAPGERYDIELIAQHPGAWVIHCHELHHAAGGMVMPFLYDGFKLLDATMHTSNSDKESVSTDHNMHHSH